MSGIIPAKSPPTLKKVSLLAAEAGGTIRGVTNTGKARLLTALAVILAVGLIALVPPARQRIAWRVERAVVYLRGALHPAGELPAPQPSPEAAGRVATVIPITPTLLAPTPSPTALAQNAGAPTPALTPTPLPDAVSLPAPEWEQQDINNCGPASLAMALRYYGWEGDQFEIASLLKPQREDRNVNVEEMVYYVRTRAGWLNAIYRVHGDLALLKKLLAAGYPVLIEESFYFEEPFWPDDDLWAAHYNLLTGYDDAGKIFTVQDSFHGPNRSVPYATLEEYWRVFNRVYLVIYPPAQEETIKAILGADWDETANRQRALEATQAEAQSNSQDAYTWFNAGSNLVYFERYREAAAAFDRAREIGLPQRMLRYQFTPFFAYFHTRRIADLLALTDYALTITPNAEEAFLWRGWARYRDGDTPAALEDFQAALRENPQYQDAQYALDFVRANP
jgi:tetratricopeptide (TPR) repeat protein